ncbi:globin domain-containing protein [Kitasatospora sp. CB01950]|uniref:globin domain-containing protein n=1 Tax=Kitasatospora sp. CB01950 TaxID=1703930 RepID=UPI0009F9A468|nr:globin domain-containing protein [Kitasatospora sp. CB01950]
MEFISSGAPRTATPTALTAAHVLTVGAYDEDAFSPEYDRLLARHHAMRLRRSILAPPGRSSGPQRPSVEPPEPGDRDLIVRHLTPLLPFDSLIEVLYDAMFLRRPYLRRLFPESMEFQRQHLGHMFQHLIDHLDRPDELDGKLRALGADHRKLGVWPAHYEAFEEALTTALRVRGGRAWTGQVEAAWLRMLRFSVAAMVAGAEAASTEPPFWHGEVVGHERRRPDLAVLRVRTGEPYPYRAGQYAALESPLLPHTWRTYSVACAPREDRVLEFHVRRTSPGGLSAALVDGTGVGDQVRVGPARGELSLDGDGSDVHRDLLLIGGGTGLAPMKALVEEFAAAHRARGRRVRLVVAARGREDLYDWPAMVELAANRSWLELTPVLGPDLEGLAALLRGHQSLPGLALLSGPIGMVAGARSLLLDAGVPDHRIRYDGATRGSR